MTQGKGRFRQVYPIKPDNKVPDTPGASIAPLLHYIGKIEGKGAEEMYNAFKPGKVPQNRSNEASNALKNEKNKK